MILIIFICFLIVIYLLFAHKPARFYIFSYFFSELYDHPTVANFFGIRYVDVEKWKTSRKDSRIYSCGIFVKLLRLITGMDLRINDETIKQLIILQNKSSREINMEPYFDEIDGKILSLQDFEYFVSKILLVETNRAFKILDNETEIELKKYISVVFDVLNGLSGGMIEGIFLMLWHFKSLYKVSKILKKISEPERLIVFGPQLSLVTNFTKMIWRKKGILKELQPNDFLDLSTKFFVFETWENGFQELIFAKRDTRDTSNSTNNKAFGPTGVLCPGNRISIDYIRSILSFLQLFDIEFQGEVIFKGNRFKNIVNKEKVNVLFKRQKN